MGPSDPVDSELEHIDRVLGQLCWSLPLADLQVREHFYSQEIEMGPDAFFTSIILGEPVVECDSGLVRGGRLYLARHDEVAVKLVQPQDHASNRIEPLGEGHLWQVQVNAPEGHLEEAPGYGAAIVRCHPAVAKQLHVKSALVAVELECLLATTWFNQDVPRRETLQSCVAQFGTRQLTPLGTDAITRPHQRDGGEVDESVVEVGELLVVAPVTDDAFRQHHWWLAPESLGNQAFRYDMLHASEWLV